MPNKVPLGKPLRLTDKQLTEAAQVTEEDIAEAVKFWRENAPEEFETLLDAVLVDFEEEG